MASKIVRSRRRGPDPGPQGSAAGLDHRRRSLVLLLVGSPITVIPAGHVGVKDLFGQGLVRRPPAGRPLRLPVHPRRQDVDQDPGGQGDGGSAFQGGSDHGPGGLAPLPAGSLEGRRHLPDGRRELPGDRRPPADPVGDPGRSPPPTTPRPSTPPSASRSRGRRSELFSRMSKDRGIIGEAVLLRKIGLPAIVANAIQEKLKREQEAEQMKFVLQKESQEAERKRIEAQGIADFNKIVALRDQPAAAGVEGHRGDREARPLAELQDRRHRKPEVRPSDHPGGGRRAVSAAELGRRSRTGCTSGRGRRGRHAGEIARAGPPGAKHLAEGADLPVAASRRSASVPGGRRAARAAGAGARGRGRRRSAGRGIRPPSRRPRAGRRGPGRRRGDRSQRDRRWPTRRSSAAARSALLVREGEGAGRGARGEGLADQRRGRRRAAASRHGRRRGSRPALPSPLGRGAGRACPARRAAARRARRTRRRSPGSCPPSATISSQSATVREAARSVPRRRTARCEVGR